MKKLDFYIATYQVSSKKDIFALFLKTLKPGNMMWNHFINWDKVFKNVSEIEKDLNILNRLTGKDNFDKMFSAIIKKHPSVVKILPALAVRVGIGTNKFDILTNYNHRKLFFEEYDFTEFNEKDIKKYLTFVEKTGIKKILQDKKVKNLVDYMIGVEAGLDSNARKNRAGDAMENIVDRFIQNFCKKKGYKYIKEANAGTIKKEFGYNIPINKQNRRYDFVVDDGKRPIVFEVNFYNSKGGSKLKATAGEYIGLHALLKKSKVPFIWITDGPGWGSVGAGLSEAFDSIDYIFNIDMLEKGILTKAF